MDVLSDVLSLLKVSSALSSRFEGSGSWAFRFPAYRHVKFGSVLSGRIFLWTDSSKSPVVLEAGDFYLLSDGQPFYTASNPDRKPLDGPSTYNAHRAEDGIVYYHGQSDKNCILASLAGGRFTFENDVTDIPLRHLPPIIHLRATDPGSQTLSQVLGLLRSETSGLQVGAGVARSSLAALALVHVLRAYLASADNPQGWFAALADPKIGLALNIMHTKPGDPWTVDRLAKEVNMSRTTFSEHFRRKVGSPPLDYLHQWRMTIAQTALKHSDEPLAQIAERVGYMSDVAFSIAFKRSTGTSPGRFRAENKLTHHATASVHDLLKLTENLSSSLNET
ncbi:AraC family transcriptional regulator [Burkholderia cenocepacia]|uniref:AraC family transcriptional regulator n=1 Tax=Burkholderia cenocepacia TaxID=95486 RepID=UPI0009B31629|nr:AraC family transcriptional regulator [Burkholderia cenocepacia]MDF0504654.1 AraC family transcriptional regulator [Burkholderia cenocepacia]